MQIAKFFKNDTKNVDEFYFKEIGGSGLEFLRKELEKTFGVPFEFKGIIPSGDMTRMEKMIGDEDMIEGYYIYDSAELTEEIYLNRIKQLFPVPELK